MPSQRRRVLLTEGTVKGAGVNASPTGAKPDLPPPAQSGHRRYDTPPDPVVGSKPLLDPKLKQTIGHVSGLKSEELERIAAQVKDNWTKLNGCANHDFVIDDRVPYQPMRERYVCRTCGGTIDSVAFHWWERGKKDAHA